MRVKQRGQVYFGRVRWLYIRRKERLVSGICKVRGCKFWDVPYRAELRERGLGVEVVLRHDSRHCVVRLFSDGVHHVSSR